VTSERLLAKLQVSAMADLVLVTTERQLMVMRVSVLVDLRLVTTEELEKLV